MNEKFYLFYSQRCRLYIFIETKAGDVVSANILDEHELCEYLFIEYRDGVYHWGRESYLSFDEIPLAQEDLSWIAWHLTKKAQWN